jgi:hypothetical protein
MHLSKNKVTIALLLLVFLCAVSYWLFEKKYEGRIYPNITVGDVPFGGKTKQEVASYWQERNTPFSGIQFELKFSSTIATISGNHASVIIDLLQLAYLSAVYVSTYSKF